MKTICLLLISIMTMVGNATNPFLPCAKDAYPDLLTGAGIGEGTLPNGDVVTHIVHTIPFSKVTYLKGAMYQVIHPDIENECAEIKTVITDTWSEGLRGLVEMVEKYPNALSACDISIKLRFVNGKTDGVWKLYTTGSPIHPEKL